MVDPITLEVVSNRLQEISRTMEHILFHTGYSTILRESQDGSAGITDREGHVVGGSAGETIHLTPYAYTVKGILNTYRYDEMEEGDSFVVNDPPRGLSRGTAVAADEVLVAGQDHQGGGPRDPQQLSHAGDDRRRSPGPGGMHAGRRPHARPALGRIRAADRAGVVRGAPGRDGASPAGRAHNAARRR